VFESRPLRQFDNLPAQLYAKPPAADYPFLIAERSAIAIEAR
jgi:hypothetical protein